MTTRSGKQAVTLALLTAAIWCVSASVTAAESDIRGPDVTIIAEANLIIWCPPTRPKVTGIWNVPTR
jgi:hypothetical protein